MSNWSYCKLMASITIPKGDDDPDLVEYAVRKLFTSTKGWRDIPKYTDNTGSLDVNAEKWPSERNKKYPDLEPEETVKCFINLRGGWRGIPYCELLQCVTNIFCELRNEKKCDFEIIHLDVEGDL